MNRLNKRLIRQSFERAAKHYAAGADLQRCLATRLISFAKPYLSTLPKSVQLLDAGCGCGINIPMLTETFSGAHSNHIVGVDIATAMLQQAKNQISTDTTAPVADHTVRFICGDLEALPIKNGTFDVVFSTAALQWCNDIACVIREFRRVSNAGSRLLIATYGPTTLYELHNSWQGIDHHRHTLDFVSVNQLTRHCGNEGFRILHCKQQREVVLYPNVKSLLIALKTIGVKNCRNDRARGLTSPTSLQKMMKNYVRRYGQCNKKSIPASYEIIQLVGQAI